MHCKQNHSKGFTLVELLIVITIFGLVIGGMYGLYDSMQRTTVYQEDFIDIQQNLRVAMDRVSRDIKMAAFLIPSTQTGIIAPSNATTLTLQTSSTAYAFARITDDVEVSGAQFVFNISDSNSVDIFEAGDTVRIIRPQDGLQPSNTDLQVIAKNRNGPTITVGGFPAGSFQYKPGDIIAQSVAGAPDPSTITWSVIDNDGDGDLELIRTRDNGPVAILVDDVDPPDPLVPGAAIFEYLDSDGNATADFTQVQAVRVNLTANAPAQHDRQVHQRSLTTITNMRN
jgi:prepilin-type N-terminal cleavage/methylation domain-containing protein